MALTRLDEANFLDFNALAYVRIEDTEDGIKAVLKFKDGGLENVVGDTARTLSEILNGNDIAETVRESSSPSHEPQGDSRQSLRFEDLSLSRGLGRNKAWFHRKDENGREYFLAFVNAKGSCSLRTFDAEKGNFLGKHYAAGDYWDNFADLITGATEVTVKAQPNLERDCKERLPDRLLEYLRKQTAH